MAVPNVFDIYMFVGSLIRAHDAPALPEKPRKLLMKGLEIPTLAGVDEWLSFEMLLSDTHAARRVQHEETLYFQLVCFTVDAVKREDKILGRQYQLANIYKPLLHQRDYMLENTCIRFKECKMTFLDLRTSTFTAQAIATGGTPPLQTQSAVLLIEASIITPKD